MSEITRRSVLAVPLIAAQSKAAADFHNTTIGHGAFRYRVDLQWSQADPSKTPVNDCHEMVQVSDGR